MGLWGLLLAVFAFAHQLGHGTSVSPCGRTCAAWQVTEARPPTKSYQSALPRAPVVPCLPPCSFQIGLSSNMSMGCRICAAPRSTACQRMWPSRQGIASLPRSFRAARLGPRPGQRSGALHMAGEPATTVYVTRSSLHSILAGWSILPRARSAIICSKGHVSLSGTP